MPQRVNASALSKRDHAFTIVELLVVIGIIVVLISILIPAVAKVRSKAQDAATRAWMGNLSQAIDQYNADFRSYPGPLSNDEVWTNNATGPAIQIDPTQTAQIATAGFVNNQSNFEKYITMSENLVLGLLGGLRFDIPTSKIYYDPRAVGNGPNTLSARPGKRATAYLEAKNLSWRVEGGLKTGLFKDDDGNLADDTIVPEFMDSYPDAMPILYLRARKGSKQLNAADQNLPDTNAIITWDANDMKPRSGHYDLHQIIGYTGKPIGVGRKVTPVNHSGTSPHGISTVDPTAILTTTPTDASQANKYQYPFDAYPYFRNQIASTPMEGTADYGTRSGRNDVPQQKDGYILISAGLDHVYGTKDDVTNFGSVGN